MFGSSIIGPYVKNIIRTIDKLLTQFNVNLPLYSDMSNKNRVLLKKHWVCIFSM